MTRDIRVTIGDVEYLLNDAEALSLMGAICRAHLEAVQRRGQVAQPVTTWPTGEEQDPRCDR